MPVGIHNPIQVVAEYQTVKNIMLYTGSNDVSKKQSVLRVDFVDCAQRALHYSHYSHCTF